MPDWLDMVIYFVGSGLAFFVGAGLAIFGVVISFFAVSRPLKLTRNLAVLIGSLLIAISATPLAWWIYGALGAIIAIWLGMEWFAKKGLIVVRLGVLAIWLGVVGWELRYQFTPTVPALGNPKLFLIGDSVSAGMSDREKNRWPQLLANQRNITVVDLSKMGATVGSARKQAEQIGDESGLILLEIGGNDVLGSTTADQFDERLNELLDDVCRHGRTVVMLELPLTPFANQFGLIQRRLVHQHGAILIPRRIFISVLTTTGSTVDGIHLTPRGHERMAAAMWEVVRPAYGVAK